MEASREMLEVVLLLGHWLHSRQSGQDPHDPDSLVGAIARMRDEEKLSEAIYVAAKTLTESELNNLIADLDQLKHYFMDARSHIYSQEVEQWKTPLKN
jgi:hypothetical protein